MDKYTFQNDPIAQPASIVSGPNFRFTVIDQVVLRYEWSADGQFEDRPSAFATNRNFPSPEYRVETTDKSVDIWTSSFHLRYDKQRFSPQGLTVNFSSKNTLWGAVWRYGDEPEKNLGGTARTLDGVDGRCDLGHGILSRAGYSAIDDSGSMLFDGDGFVAPRRVGDRIDGYLFSYGFDYRKAIKSLYAISGKQPIIPRWALGNWWSRYYAYSDKEYIDLMDKFRSHDTPLSVAVLDMDWHVVKDEKVPHSGWTGYTWNKELFPDPIAFKQNMEQRRLKVSLNDHPHAGVHCHEDQYLEMASVLQHNIDQKAAILFDPTSPRFMHAYLNVLHRSVEKQACDFWWIDWQQGRHSQVPGLDPLWLLNHFQYLDQNLQSNRGTSIILSRYGGLGSHRYPVGFSGDTITTWASLQFQPEFTATASNVGYGWWSHDIGGHMGGIRDDELSVRWTQFGVFSPMFRLHSTDSKWASKEPWLYRTEFAHVLTHFMQLRHRIVPYIFALQHVARDEPLIQPVYWHYPERNEAYRFPTQYFFGPRLVVSPIVHPRDPKTNHGSTEMWLPPGRFVDVFTGLVYDGDRSIRLHRKIDHIPILAPEGCIVPLDGQPSPENGCPNPSSLEVLVVVGANGGFQLFEDTTDDLSPDSISSDASHRLIDIRYEQASGRLETTSSGKDWTFRFLSVMEIPTSLKIMVDGVELPNAPATVLVDDRPKTPGLVVKVPKCANVNSTVSIELGATPELSKMRLTDWIDELLLDFQVPFADKDRISAICQPDSAKISKVGQLLSLGADESVLGPILELLVADSRQ